MFSFSFVFFTVADRREWNHNGSNRLKIMQRSGQEGLELTVDNPPYGGKRY